MSWEAMRLLRARRSDWSSACAEGPIIDCSMMRRSFSRVAGSFPAIWRTARSTGPWSGSSQLRSVRRTSCSPSSRQQAEGIQRELAAWLAERGLTLNEDKTRIVRLADGFDFLGWNFRRYPAGKTLVKPSREAIGRHRQRLADETRSLRGSNARAVAGALIPVIRGWTAYHRMNDKWVFGDRDTGVYLRRHSWTGIRRHVMVKGRASPDDPDLAGYWENRYRRKKHGLALDTGTLSLLTRQENRCPHCRDPLIDVAHLPASPEGWEQWWLSVTRRAAPRAPSAARAQPPEENTARPTLMHMTCHRSLTQAARRKAA
jgi:RNA-directed DNA polymerase